MDSLSNADKNPEEGWLSWAKYVLKTLQSHEDLLKELKKQEHMDILEFERFKTKVETRSSSVSAVISVIVTIIINLLVVLLTR